MKTANTWLLVADGAQARIFQYKGAESGLELVEEGELHHVNAKSSELAESERGGAAGLARSTTEWNTDPHEQEKVKFAVLISEFLGRRQEQFDKLILTAPAKMLGYLRKELPQQVQAKVSLEISKDLTKITVNNLPKHFDGKLPVRDNPDHFNQKAS